MLQIFYYLIVLRHPQLVLVIDDSFLTRMLTYYSRHASLVYFTNTLG
jgi:hypothetical protein